MLERPKHTYKYEFILFYFILQCHLSDTHILVNLNA